MRPFLTVMESEEEALRRANADQKHRETNRQRAEALGFPIHAWYIVKDDAAGVGYVFAARYSVYRGEYDWQPHRQFRWDLNDVRSFWPHFSTFVEMETVSNTVLMWRRGLEKPESPRQQILDAMKGDTK